MFGVKILGDDHFLRWLSFIHGKAMKKKRYIGHSNPLQRCERCFIENHTATIAGLGPEKGHREVEADAGVVGQELFLVRAQDKNVAFEIRMLLGEQLQLFIQA